MLLSNQTSPVRTILGSCRSWPGSSARRDPHHPAGQPAHFSQETTHIPADLNKIKTFRKPSRVSTPSRTVFTLSFQTTLGAKHRLTGLFRRPLGDLRVKNSFRVHPFPQHLHPCKDHHHTAPLPLFLYLSFAGDNRVWGSNLHLCPHIPTTRGQEVQGGGRTEVSQPEGKSSLHLEQLLLPSSLREVNGRSCCALMILHFSSLCSDATAFPI